MNAITKDLESLLRREELLLSEPGETDLPVDIAIVLCLMTAGIIAAAIYSVWA